MAENDVSTIKEREIDVGGRPCKYESHVEPRLMEIYQWVKEGMTDYSIAETLGIHHNTLIRYKDSFKDLREVYTRAQHERNRLVMNKMFQKATGEKVTLLKQKATKDGDILDLTEEQYIPPDVNAADLFLRNNDPEYKSAKSAETGQNITVNFQLPQLEQELQQIAEQRKALEMQLNSGVWEIADE